MNQIWNDNFCTKEKGAGIYKIYFKDFPDSVYIGHTTASAGFSSRLSQHKSNLWKIFNGASSKGSLTDSGLLKQREFNKLSETEKKAYLKKSDRNFNKLLNNFKEDKINPGDSKYIKMIYLLKTKNFSLDDLVFEIIYNHQKDKDDNLFKIEHQLISEYDCYLKGFNATAMAEFIFSNRDTGQYETEQLIKMKSIIEDNKADDFLKWNCWWNLYQTFKFSFLKCPLSWMDFWKIISLENIIKSFSKITEQLFTKNENKVIKMVGDYTEDEFKKVFYEIFEIEHPNLKIYMDIKNRTQLKEFKKKIEWVNNDNEMFKKSVLESSSKNIKIQEFYGSWKDINDFFSKNNFDHTRSIKTFLLEEFEKTKEIADLITNKDSGVELFEYFCEELRLFNSLNNVADNFFIEYYFRINQLTFLLINN